MELQQLRVFVAIAEEGTMSAAAERLGITQPAISFSIKALEQEIGQPLFTRSRRGLRISDRGTELLATARTMLQLAATITADREAPAGRKQIRIVGRQGFMQYVFPLLVSRLTHEMPDLHIEQALSANHDEVIESIRAGKADLAFGANPKIKSITATIFHHDPVLLAVSRSHKITKKRVSLAEIARLPLCLPTRQDRLRAPIDRFLRKLPQQPRILLETNDYTLMRNLIAEGLCAGFVYGHMLLLEPRTPTIVPLHLEELDLRRDLTVLFRNDFLPPHVEQAKNILIDEARRVLTNRTM
jgi:DNA-binding transcriptional LysR family regulator